MSHHCMGSCAECIEELSQAKAIIEEAKAIILDSEHWRKANMIKAETAQAEAARYRACLLDVYRATYHDESMLSKMHAALYPVPQ